MSRLIRGLDLGALDKENSAAATSAALSAYSSTGKKNENRASCEQAVWRPASLGRCWMGSSSKSRGWVNVSVQTYQSQRNSSSRILQQDYTVDESGATLNALARNSEGPEAEEAKYT